MARALVTLYVLLLLFPSADHHVFNGLPLSSVPELVGLGVVLPAVASRAVRTLVGRLVRWLGRRIVWGLVGAGGLALAAKLVLLASGTHGGFLACYRSPVAAPPAGPCERSYENLFARFGATRLDRVLDFGPGDWNLSFFNTKRLAVPFEPGNIVRTRLPLEVTWRGAIESRGPWIARVAYVGEATLELGSAPAVALPPRYGAVDTALVPIPPGRHALAIRYRFDDGSRVGAGPPPGPWATFRLHRARPGEADGPPVRGVKPSRPWRVAGAGVDLVVAALGALLLAPQVASLGREWAMLGLVAAGGYVASVYLVRWAWLGPGALFTGMTWLLFGRLVARPRPRSLLLAYVSLAYLNGLLARRSFPTLATVTYRSPGDDWLTYEAFARTILETGSLEGGERVFGMQPLFRYIRFGEHALLGDGDPFLLIVATTALQWGVSWLASRLARGRPLSRPWAMLFVASGAALLGLAGSTTVLQFIAAGLSEYPTWIALPYVVTMLFLSRSPAHGLLGTAMLGLSLLTRTNQAPALLAMLLVFLAGAWRDRRRVALGSVGLLIVLLLLPVAHNVYYGGHAVFVSRTAGIPENVVAPPSLWLAAVSDPGARAEVWRHLRYLLYLTTSGEAFLQVVMRGLQLVWLVTVVGLLVMLPRLPLRAWVLMALPALYLGVHLVYQVQVYYPRHLVAGYLAMGVAAMYAARLRAGPSRAMRGREEAGLSPPGAPKHPRGT